MYTNETGHLLKDTLDVARPNQKYPGPDFGMYSTAWDVFRFCQVMLQHGSRHGHQVLSPSLISAMVQPLVPTSFPAYYTGLGWAVHPAGAAQPNYPVTNGAYGHDGAAGGRMWVDPSRQLVRIFLTHRFGGDFTEADTFMKTAFAA